MKGFCPNRCHHGPKYQNKNIIGAKMIGSLSWFGGWSKFYHGK